MRYKSFLAGAVLGLLIFGLGAGVLVAENLAEIPSIFKGMKVLGSSAEEDSAPAATAASTHASLSGCKTEAFTAIGVSGCWPSDWQKTDEEGPRGTMLGEVVLQSPNFKVLVGQGSNGSPEIRIKSGYQLSIRVTRITADSDKATMAQLKAFWEANRTAHGIAREEEITVGGLPALYHFLSTPKEGGQTDTHIIKGQLLYDINFYFSDGQNGQGENFFRGLLGKISFEPVDPKIEINSGRLMIGVPSGQNLAGYPMTLTITKDSGLEITSQPELPVIVGRLKTESGGTVLGTAKPQGDGVNQTTYTLSWTPVAGDYEITAEVISNNGMIYESVPVGVTVGGKQ